MLFWFQIDLEIWLLQKYSTHFLMKIFIYAAQEQCTEYLRKINQIFREGKKIIEIIVPQSFWLKNQTNYGVEI